MLNLLISILAISLVGILSMSAIYYGSDVLSRGIIQSDSRVIVNNMLQFSNKLQEFRDVEGSFPQESTFEFLSQSGFSDYFTSVADERPLIKQLYDIKHGMRFSIDNNNAKFIVAEFELGRNQFEEFTPKHCSQINTIDDSSCSISGETAVVRVKM